MARPKFSGAAVLLIVVVPVFMYAGALLIGIQLGRALERRQDSVSIRGALFYVAKELWDTNNVFGRRRDRDESEALVLQPAPANLFHDGSSDDTDRYSSKQHPPQAQRFHTNHVDADGRVHVDTEGVHFVMEKPRHGHGRRHGQPKHPGSSPRSADDMVLESKATPSKAERYHISNHTSPRGVMISVGPWGGSGGQPFYMLRGSSAPPRRLHSIVMQESSGSIHSLACDYTGGDDDDGIITRAGPWGRPHSYDEIIALGSAGFKLSAGEHLIAVEGTIGHFSNVPAVVTSLAFRTSAGKTYGPYGNDTTTPFSVAAADGACIVGFWGRSGLLLDALGVYITTACASSSNPPAYNTTRRA